MAIAKIGGIPVYNATIPDEECGMMKISLVDDPAVMSNFLAFGEQTRQMAYAIQDEEKRLIIGAVMRANFPIYRYDKKIGEYYIMYSPETIRLMAEKYLVDDKQNNVNLMHQEGSDVEGVNLVQWFIKDTEKGINPDGIDAEDGSLLAEFHVTNDDVWEDIKNGVYKGFSLEGLFGMIPNEESEQVEQIVDSLDGKFSKVLNILSKSISMTKFTKFKAALLKVLTEFANITTDKGVLSWDGEDEIKVDDSVYLEDAEGNRTKAEDGDYKTEDGKVIKVADGKVTEIVDDNAEVAPVEETKMSRIKRIATAFSESYDEKLNKIWDAVKDNHLFAIPFGYIYEAGDDYAVICYYGENTDWEDRFVRFDVSWDADGNAVVSNPVEIKRSFVPVDADPAPAPADPTPSEAEETLRKENEDLRKEVEELRKLSGAKSAHVEFQVSGGDSKSGVKGIDKINHYMSL